MKIISSFKQKHSDYFSVVWTISMYIGFFIGVWKWIEAIFLNAQHGSMVGFLLAFAMQSVLIFVYGIIAAVSLFITIFLITFLPYLLIRGLTK